MATGNGTGGGTGAGTDVTGDAGILFVRRVLATTETAWDGVFNKLGQTYQKLGEKDKAFEYYSKASTAIAHNPAAAYAVPLARKNLTLLPS